MKNILIIGAGRSSNALITYLLDHADAHDWHITVGDLSLDLAKEKIKDHSRGAAIRFSIDDEEAREQQVIRADLVISMLPATLHYAVAVSCVKNRKPLITASYVSKELHALDADARAAGIMLLNEIGLDPGIDHMSAMKVIDEIHGAGGELTAFYSYCGGLVAPESNDNPWGYKFSWNPRNVILAGQGTAQFIRDGKYKYLPYSRLFSAAETIHVDGCGDFDAYANRDSLSYRPVYGLENIPTMLRGTLRMPGFCRAWNALVQLGITDETWKIRDSGKLTYRELIEAFLPEGNGSIEKRTAEFLREEENGEVMQKLAWAGLFDETRIPLSDASPAQILQELLERKWKLRPGDKDMVVMQHCFEFKRGDKAERITSSFVLKGLDDHNTAMAKTVGLPAAIAAKLILQGKITRTGVCIPVTPDIYKPVLEELENSGIRFSEKKETL
jgi:saccharopine dehydrogenase-like NADP-dependent oxidoreductase